MRPRHRARGGGATITLTGAGFEGGTSTVTVGGAAATNVVAVDDATLAGGFTYYAFPPSFPAADAHLDDGPALAADPQVCCDGARVYVAWTDNRSGNFEVYATASQP